LEIDGGRVGAPAERRQVEGPSGEPFVQKPDPARIGAGRRGANQAFNFRRFNGKEEALEDGQIKAFMLEGGRRPLTAPSSRGSFAVQRAV
jgi:hypothetical protein